MQNLIAQALVERILRAARASEKFKVSLTLQNSLLEYSPSTQVVVLIPEVPGFAGDVKDETAIRTILAGQYRTINRGGNSIYEVIRHAGYEPLALPPSPAALDD